MVMGSENGSFMNEIIALIKENPDRSLTFSIKRRHSEEITVYEPGSGLPLDTKSHGSLLLDVSGSRITRNRFLSFISHAVCGILL